MLLLHQFASVNKSSRDNWKAWIVHSQVFFLSTTQLCLQIARDIPYSAVQFTVFEMLKKLRSQRLQKEGGQQAVKSGKHMANDLWMGAVGPLSQSLFDFDKLSLFADLSVQAIRSTLCYWYLFWGTSLRQVAGAVASSLTNPLDVVKTRVMTQTRGGNVVHGGLRSIAKQIWMEEVKTHSFQTLCVANCLCNSFCSPCALCTLCARLQHFPLDIYHALWHGKHLHFDMLAGTEGVWSRYSSPSSLQGAAAYCLNLFVVCETWGVQLGLDNLEDYGYMDYIHNPCIIALERWNMSQFFLHFNFQISSMTRL